MKSEKQKYFPSMFAQASHLEANGELDEAIRIYEEILKHDKKNIKALNLLGLAQFHSKNNEAAIKSFEKAIKVAPKLIASYNNMAALYNQIKRPDKALPYALSAYKLDNNSVFTLMTVYRCYYHLGVHKKALSFIKKAFELSPEDPKIKLGLAECLDSVGESMEAENIFQELIDAEQEIIPAMDGLARCKKHKTPPPILKTMEEYLKKDGLSDTQKKNLHRAIGRILNDVKDYENAFKHFSASKTPEWGAIRAGFFEIQVAQLKEIITPEFFIPRKNWGSSSKRPIFVFGMPRSGTTLTEQILSSHPKVHGADELTFFMDFAQEAKLDCTDVNSLKMTIEKINRDFIQNGAKEYLKILNAHSNTADYVVDKMPLNFEMLWLMALTFPNATFIRLTRNPMATCTSCYIQPLGSMHSYANDLESLGRYHLQYEELMDHWKKVLPVNIIELSYEALVNDQETETRKLIAQVGLEWDDSCLEFYKNKRIVRTPSRHQVDQAIYHSGLDAWKNYRPFLKPLEDVLQNSKLYASFKD